MHAASEIVVLASALTSKMGVPASTNISTDWWGCNYVVVWVVSYWGNAASSQEASAHQQEHHRHLLHLTPLSAMPHTRHGSVHLTSAPLLALPIQKGNRAHACDISVCEV